MMSSETEFTDYHDRYLDDCLRLFDQNCPAYFALNEREDYRQYLSSASLSYFVGIRQDKVIAAFGLVIKTEANRARLSWILVSPEFQRSGIGRQMVERAKRSAFAKRAAIIDISASHLSAPFFEKFGAVRFSEVPNGWGPGMHRVEMQLRL